MTKCSHCGKFISLDDNRNSYTFIPDTEFTCEESYWTCYKCSGHTILITTYETIA